MLGPDSQAAAYVSLGAARQGRFRQFHDRLFALGRPTDGDGRPGGAGDRHPPRGRNRRGAAPSSPAISSSPASISASGTPTFVVGDQVLQGAVGYDALKAAIAAARARRGLETLFRHPGRSRGLALCSEI